MHYIFVIFRPFQINNACGNFRPHGSKRVPILRSQEKGVLAKGISAESSVTPKETKKTPKYWAQQCIWHSEHHSQERRTFLQKPPSKKPLFLVLDIRCSERLILIRNLHRLVNLRGKQHNEHKQLSGIVSGEGGGGGQTCFCFAFVSGGKGNTKK